MLRFLDHTQSHTPSRTPPNQRSARRRGCYLHNTQQTQEINVHALSGIRTRDLRNQANADIHLTLHGHRDGPCCNYVILSFVVLIVCRYCVVIVLYCIVVGSRRLMPPDALQPKAYCTIPGLWSFLLAPPGVSTRDPSSERRNYMGEKWPMNFA